LILYMLDTNTLSDIAVEKSLAARYKLSHLASDDMVCISSITEGELRYGIARKPDSVRTRNAIENVLSKVQILPWGHEEAMAYGVLRAKLQAMGKPLESMDLLIAAHAISVGAVLVTRDKVFSQVQDLPAVVNWATDLS